MKGLVATFTIRNSTLRGRIWLKLLHFHVKKWRFNPLKNKNSEKVFIFLNISDRLIVSTLKRGESIFTKVENAFESRILNKDIQYYHLRFGNSGSGERTVLFVQDGKDYLELGDFEQILIRIIDKTDFKGFLDIYMIHPGDSWARYGYYHIDQPNHRDFLDFFHNEFYPIVISDNNTVHKIGILGDSLAALVSLSIAIQQPKRFTHLLLQSMAYDPTRLLANSLKDEVNHWRVYQLVGLKEDAFISPLTGQNIQILSYNRALHKRFQQLDVPVHYYEEEDEHGWAFWRRTLDEAITYFFTK